MIIIGEKINGAIPAVKAAIAARDAEVIRQRAIARPRPEPITWTVRPLPHRKWNTMPWSG